MSFKDYSTTPADNTELGDGTYIGPDMLRNKVRPALQQIAADGKELSNHVEDLLDLAQGEPGGDGSLLPKFTLISTGVDIPSDIELVQTVGYNATDVGSAVYAYDAAVDSAYVTAHPRSSFLANDGRGFRLSLEQEITPQMFGAVGDGVVDDTTAVQSAFDAVAASGGELFVPAGKYRLTSAITISLGLAVRGVRPRSKKTVSGLTTEQYGGSWFFFDHTGKGFNLASSGDYYTDFDFRDFGTYRSQPTPTGGWAPTDHDFDIYCNAQNDIHLEGLLLYNPTRAVGLANAGGRMTVRDLRGQPLKIGIQIDGAADVCRIEDIHFWPFWKIDANVQSYTLANLDAIYSLKNDNPVLSNIFAIYARAGLRIGQSGLGGTSRLSLVNGGFDTSKDGVWVDNTVTAGMTAQIENVYHLADNSALGGMAVRVDGNNSNIDIGKLHTTNCRTNAVKIAGTGNTVTIGRTIVEGYDLSTSNAPALEVASGSVLYLLDHPLIANGTGTGTGGRLGGAGYISANEWRVMVTPPTITSTSGTITSIAATGIYRRFNDTVRIRMEIANTTNGTGAGALTFALPIPPAARAVGVGRNLNSGKQLQVLATTPNTVTIANYDNAYPVASGETLVIELEYQG
jgi:hypothetical protein